LRYLAENDWFHPPSADKGNGAAELLAARGFALLLMLSECEEPSFMDQVAQHAPTRRLADHVNNRAAAYIGQVGPLGWAGELGLLGPLLAGMLDM
jgi:hypothetical protein